MKKRLAAIVAGYLAVGQCSAQNPQPTEPLLASERLALIQIATEKIRIEAFQGFPTLDDFEEPSLTSEIASWRGMGEADLNQLIEKTTKVDAPFDKGLGQFLKGNYADAVQDFSASKKVVAASDLEKASLLCGWSQILAGDFTGAKKEFGGGADPGKDTVEKSIALAVVDVRLDNLNDAAVVLKSAITRLPDSRPKEIIKPIDVALSRELHLLLANIESQQGESGEAFKEIDEALKSGGGDPTSESLSSIDLKFRTYSTLAAFQAKYYADSKALPVYKDAGETAEKILARTPIKAWPLVRKALLLSRTADCQLSSWNLAEARKTSEAALAVLAQIKDDKLESPFLSATKALVLLTSAKIERDVSDYFSCLKRLSEARLAAEENGPDKQQSQGLTLIQAEILRTVADLNAIFAHHDESLESYQKALDVFGKADEKKRFDQV